jgi:mutator protein MutT
VSSGSPIEAAAAVVLDDTGRVLLIKESYGRERWGFPGGALEPGEAPEEAVVREAREETGVEIRVDSLVGVFAVAESRVSVHVFRSSIVSGTPAVPAGGEIADVRWWRPDALPWPQTNALYHALPDALAGRSNVTRRGLTRVT